jgi:hypothetical protein
VKVLFQSKEVGFSIQLDGSHLNKLTIFQSLTKKGQQMPCEVHYKTEDKEYCSVLTMYTFTTSIKNPDLESVGC